MVNKWLILGIIIFIISGLGWFITIIFSVITLGGFRNLANFFGIIFVVSLPSSILLAILDKKRKNNGR